MKVGCYVRVSTEDQIDNYSIDAQVERLTNYCKAKDWNLIRCYTDPGFSGSTINRPALKRLIDDIKKKEIDLILVYKLDRLSRSQKDTLYLIEDIFLKNHVEFVSLCENFDTSTPFGRAMIGILSVFAQLEREQIKERLTMGRTARAKEGLFHGGGYAPVGYDYIEGKLVVNDYEAIQVRELFELYLKGYSINYICNYLSRTYTTKYSSWNSPRTVSHCLLNTIYIGKIKFNGKEYNGSHSPIIEESIFQKANLLYIRKHVKNKEDTSYKPPYKASQLLSGILYCNNCKAKYHCNHGYYKCYSRSKSSPKFINNPNCKNKNWRIEVLDDIIKNEVTKLKFDTSHITQLDLFKNDESKEILEKQCIKLDKKIKNLLTLSDSSNYSYSQISSIIDQLQLEKSSLILKLNTIRNRIEAVAPHYLCPFDHLDITQQRYFIQSLIDNIILDEDNITIHWKFKK